MIRALARRFTPARPTPPPPAHRLSAELARLQAELAELQGAHIVALDVGGRDAAALRQRAERAEHERDRIRAALRRHAADAHHRKRRHEDSNPAAYDELNRLGNDLLTTWDGDE